MSAPAACVCDDPEFCGGADINPDEPGYCPACDALDPEEHCLNCAFECCKGEESSSSADDYRPSARDTLTNALFAYRFTTLTSQSDDGKSLVWHASGRQFKVTITELFDYPEDRR